MDRLKARNKGAGFCGIFGQMTCRDQMECVTDRGVHEIAIRSRTYEIQHLKGAIG